MSVRESDFDCPHRADVAAYVLGALDDGELRGFREHLDGCAQCRAEVAELQPVVDELPASVPAGVASAALRERILATVRSEAELLRAAGDDADRPPPRRTRRWRLRGGTTLGAGAALAVAVVVAVVAVVIGLGSSSSSEHVWRGTAPAGAAASLRQRDGRAELVVSRMPQPPSGQIYEVWLSRGRGDARPTDALFGVTGAGSGSVDVPGELHGIKEVMVTSEPLGGSSHPTSEPLIRVALRS